MSVATYVMVIVWPRPHARAAYNSESPISEWCRRVSCSQFGIRQIAIEILVLYVPAWIKTKTNRIELITNYSGYLEQRLRVHYAF